MTPTTQERIQQIALELFAERGYHATTMRSIAAAAQLQTASLYHWYPRKEALLVALIDRFLDDLNQRVVLALADEVEPLRRLAAAVRAHVIFHGEEKLAALVTDTELRALSADPRKHVVAQRDAYQVRFLQLIEACRTAGLVHVRDPQVATYAVLLLCTSVDAWYRSDGRLTLAEVAELHVELVLGALGSEREMVERIVSPS